MTQLNENAPKIIAYRGDRAACWFYRLHSPLIHLARNNKDKYNITVSSTINKDQIGQFDLVILQRQYKFEVLAPVLEMQKRGAKLIYEIDDNLFNVPKWNPSSKILGAKKVQDGIKNFVSRVDAMFVTTEALKDAYKDYCEHIYVLPNSIDYDLVYDYPKNTDKPVVCWQGSATHQRDLSIAQHGIEQLAKDEDLMVKIWCGFKEQSKARYDDRKPIFDVNGAEILPLVPFEGFFQMFGQLDVHIGLAPLAANPFNKCKSNLKFLEYTAYGAVTVASSFGPYGDTIEDGETGILVSDNRDWYDQVRMLVDDPDNYQRILTNAQALVKEKFNIRNTFVYWQDAIDELLKDWTPKEKTKPVERITQTVPKINMEKIR